MLYFEAEEYTFHNIYSPEEPLNSFLTKNFLSSSLYELQNKKIFDKLKEELADIIQVLDLFKIELNLNLNNSRGFKFFIIHFTSTIELYNHIGDKYLPIRNEADKLLNIISSRLYKIQEIRHTSRFLVNTYIPPNLRNEIMDYIEEVIQNSEKSESLIILCSWQKYPFIIEFQHNFSCIFDEEFTKLIKKYITDELSIDKVYWDVNVLDYSTRGILIYPDEKIDFKKVSDLLSERLVQNIYGIYTRISDYLRYYQQKLMNLDEILPKLNYSEFLSNLKLLKFNTFGEFPLLYLQEIDRILLRTTEDSAERLDPPISEIFDNSAFGYNIYDKIKSAYTSLKEELNSTLTTLQIIMSQNHTDKKTIEEKPKEKIKLVEYEKPDASISKEHKIPDIIIQGIEKAIEISKKCVSEEEKISPRVGAVLIKDNRIVETAYRGEIEEGDHAEYTLLEKKLKSKDLSNAILITTLEPCTRRSSNKTSCVERIVQAGIRQVWIGINDPNPDISARGWTYLRMKNVCINYFPDEYTQKILRLNEEFWENETKKYKRDVMFTPDRPREDKIIISSERLEKIEEKLEIRKKDETKKDKEQKSQSQDLNKPELEKYNFLVRLIYLLQKYEEVKHYEREESETIEEIGKLIGKLDIIKFYKKGLPFYKKLLRDLSQLDYTDDETVLEMRDEKYGIGFNLKPSKVGFFISPLDSKKSYYSIGYGKPVKLMVLNNFIGYLKERMTQLNLYPLLDEVEEKTRIMKIFFRLRRFLEYLFSDDYLNPVVIKERTDEQVISELNWIKQNDKELNDYFTVFNRKDEPSKYDKVLSLLNGKYLVQFRSHIPFKSTIKINGKIIESSATKKVNSTLYEIFESIKSHVKDNYKIKL